MNEENKVNIGEKKN